MKFNVGDVVICTMDTDRTESLDLGAEYIVIHSYSRGHYEFVRVRQAVENEENRAKRDKLNISFYSSRFKLKEKEVNMAKQDVNGRWRDAKGHFIKKPLQLKGPAVKNESAIMAPPPPAPAENAETVRQKLNEGVGNRGVGTCSYGFQTKNRGVILHVSDVCHARFNTQATKENPITHVALHIQGHLKNLKDSEQILYKKFVEWFVTKSPFSRYILTKDLNEVYQKGILLDPQYTVSQLATTAVALRSASEFKSNLPLWGRLVNDGVDEYVAWILCTFFTPKGDNKYMMNGFGGGHHVLSCKMNLKAVLSCVKDGLRPVNKAPMSENNERYALFQSIGDMNAYQPDPDEKGHIDNVFSVGVKKVPGGWENPLGVTPVPYIYVVGRALHMQELLK